MPNSGERFSELYTLADPRTGLVRYVGITVQGANRRKNGHIGDATKSTKTHKQAWIRSLLLLGLEPVVNVIVSGEITWSQLCALEISTIAEYRAAGFTLTNQTDGGDGSTGFAAPRTPEWNAKVSAAVTAAEARATPEQKTARAAKRAETMAQRYGSTSPTQFIDRKNLGSGWRGKTIPEEVKEKMREGQRRKWARIRDEGRYDAVCANIATGTKIGMTGTQGSSE